MLNPILVAYGACAFAKQQPETCCQLARRQSCFTKNRFYTFTIFAKDCLQEGNNDTIINLMHGVTKIHQVDTEMRYAPERVKQKVRPCPFALRLVVFGACVNIHKSAKD